DGNGGLVEQTVAVTIDSINDAPISANVAHVIDPGASYTFSVNDFTFSDSGDASHPDAFKAVIISDLPASGQLTLNGLNVVKGQLIDVASLSTLVFTAAPDAVGSDYGSFTFTVQDSGGTAHGGQDTSNPYSVGFTVKSSDAASYDDLIEAGDGNDTIYGGQGNDEMQGEGGNDVIIGGTDNGHVAWIDGRLTGIVIGDNLYGNDGRDAFHFKQGDGVDVVWDFRPGEDVIDLTGYRIQGSSVLDAPETGYALADVKVMFVRHVTEVNDRMDAGNYLKVAVLLGDRDAIVFNDFPAPSDNDTALVLQDGTLSSGQLLRLAQSNSVVAGSGGFSAVEPAGAAPPPPGADAPLTLAGTNDGDTLIGASGADHLYGNEGVNALNGKAGNDSIYGGNARDWMFGEDGDDIGYGNGGDDLIIGGSGSDKLYGAGGDDLIFGDDGQGIDIPGPWLVPSGHGISARIEIVNSWWGGFEARVTVAANESVGQWQLALRSRFKIDDLWGAQETSEVSDAGGTLYTLGNAGWNGSLANGQTTTVGFTAHTNIAGFLSAGDILQALSLSTDGPPPALPLVPAMGQVDAGIEVVNSWSGGFEGRISLTADENISYWKMLLKTKYAVDGFWNAEKAAEVSTDGGTLYSLDNAAWNGSLLKGQTITIGFTARTGTPSVLSREQILNPDNISVASDQGLVNSSANGANRTLVGGMGNDKLFAGASRDVMTGLAGRDTFVFDTRLNKKTNVDTITDFKVKDDTVNLDNAIFKKLGKVGVLKKDYFVVGTKALEKNDHIIYDKKKGVLSYDADGTGHIAAVKFATLNKNLKMTYKDFFVI
ncbi:MAG: cellulose binding domain-containing protein, partial [Microvirga sp.]